MSVQSSIVLPQETDEMDLIMSQMDTEEDVKGCVTKSNQLDECTDEMDVIISQIDIGSMHRGTDPSDMQPADITLDGMDVIISQMDTDKLQQSGVEDMPQELSEQYGEAMAEINDEIVNQMQNEDDMNVVPAELMEEYKNAMDQLIPNKSGNRYLQAYEVFRNWQSLHRISSFDEKVVMAYFGAASKKYKPPTLWSMYSMLKKTLLCKHNVDLSKHCRLRAFLKVKSDGYEGKKAKVFEAEQIHKFFVEAPNDVYLGMKVSNERNLFR